MRCSKFSEEQITYALRQEEAVMHQHPVLKCRHKRQENMATHRVGTRLNETTIRELDRGRSGRTPSPSRSELERAEDRRRETDSAA